MDHTDFSKTGGFPLDTDVLDFNHKALAAGFKWPAETDSTGNLLPLILSGCIDYHGNDYFTPGWLLIDGEVLPFAGGFANYGADSTVYIVETREEAVFEDGQTYNVLEVTRIVTVDGSLPGAVAIGEIGSFKRLEALLGERAIEVSPAVALNGVGGSFTATCTMRLNKLTRMVSLNGTIQVTNAQALASPTVMYQAAAAMLPPAAIPANQHIFQAGIRSHNNPAADDPALRDFYCEIHSATQSNPGLFSVGLRRPADSDITSYTLSFSTVYSLD